MSGKGEDVFVERPWRSLKHEEAYLRAYDPAAKARSDIDDYFQLYDAGRLPPES